MRKFLTILMGILMLAGGIYCLFTPITTYLTTGYVIGVMIFCDAIGNIIAWYEEKKYVEISGWYLANSIISLIFGIALIVSLRMQFAVDMVILYIIAFWVIVLGISRISMAIKMKKLMNELPDIFDNSKWLYILLFGILMVAFGVLCIAKPAVLSSMLGVFISILIIVAGASLITLGTYSYSD